MLFGGCLNVQIKCYYPLKFFHSRFEYALISEQIQTAPKPEILSFFIDSAYFLGG